MRKLASLDGSHSRVDQMIPPGDRRSFSYADSTKIRRESDNLFSSDLEMREKVVVFCERSNYFEVNNLDVHEVKIDSDSILGTLKLPKF